MSTSRDLPTSVTEGKLSLRRTGNTLQYLMTTEKSEELVELCSVDFSSDDVTKILLAAQCRGSVGGVDSCVTEFQWIAATTQALIREVLARFGVKPGEAPSHKQPSRRPEFLGTVTILRV